jgi:hypothetical protein
MNLGTEAFGELSRQIDHRGVRSEKSIGTRIRFMFALSSLATVAGQPQDSKY